MEAMHAFDAPRSHAADEEQQAARVWQIEAGIRRLSGVGALASLGYVGYLVRRCPAAGEVCEPSYFVPLAIGLPVAVMVVGYLASLVGGAIERQLLRRASRI